jgi:hypothetical protein
MKLCLKYEPTPANARLFAADIVAASTEIYGAHLDYTIDSLRQVDAIIERFRSDGVSSDQIAETLFGFGCYVGEVIVRCGEGRWRVTAETPMAELGGFPLVVQHGRDSFCNPIGKVFKRLANGPEDSLAFSTKPSLLIRHKHRRSPSRANLGGSSGNGELLPAHNEAIVFGW